MREHPERNRQRGRIHMRNIPVALCGIAMAAGLGLWSCAPPQQEEKQTVAEATYGAAQVSVFEVRRQKVSEKLFYTGLIEARDKTAINPEIGGRIARIYVESGDRVRKDQLLAELDTRSIRLQLEQAEAAQAVAQAAHNDAARNMERMERLKKENAVSDQQYEQIRLAFESADAQLKQARAAVNLARYSLDVSIMKAPYAGIIGARNAEVGDVVNPMMGGLTAGGGVLTLMDFSQVKIRIEVSQDDVVRIRRGQPALLAVSSYPDRRFEGLVSVVNLAADPVTKKFLVEVRVDNPDLALRPNTFGDISLEVSSHENTLVIPQMAVLENSYVFVARDGRAARREVSIGLEDVDYLEILDGLAEGESVIVEGNYGLEDGARIEVKEVTK